MTNIDRLHRDIKAIKHHVRSNIIDILSKQKELNVTEIEIQYYRKYEIEKDQSVISHHLRILKDSQIVKMRVDKKYRYYSLNRNKLEQIVKTIENYQY